MAGPDYSGEVTLWRAILNGLVGESNVAYPGDNFDPPNPSTDPTNPTIWYDVDWSDLGLLPGQPTQELDFGGGRGRRVTLDIAICVQLGPNAEKKALEKAELLETAFTGQDTSAAVYRYLESYLGPSGPWQEVWYRQDWILPIDRYEDGSVVSVSATQKAITQASHGFANEWVGKSGGDYVKAGSDEAVGFATNISTNQFLLTLAGPVTWTSHGLSDGAIYLHISTGGGSQSAVPGVGERYQRVGYSIDANTIVVRPEPKLGV